MKKKHNPDPVKPRINEKWARRLLLLVAIIAIGAPTACAFSAPAGAQENNLTHPAFLPLCEDNTDCTEREEYCTREHFGPGSDGAFDQAKVEAFNRCLGREEIDYDLPHARADLPLNRAGDPHDLEYGEYGQKLNLALDISVGGALDFTWFGSRASGDPYGNVALTYDNIGEDDSHGWEITYLGNRHIGPHEEGSLVDYHDVIVGHRWKFADGKYDLFAGVENFYGPAQYGADWLLFIAPVAKFSFTPNERWDLATIVQYVGTHHVEYSGDRIFLVEEFTLHPIRKKRFELDLTVAGVLGNTGRKSLYWGPALTFPLGGVDLWAKAYWIYTIEAGGGTTNISPKPIIGFSWSN